MDSHLIVAVITTAMVLAAVFIVGGVVWLLLRQMLKRSR